MVTHHNLVVVLCGGRFFDIAVATKHGSVAMGDRLREFVKARKARRKS